MGKASRKRNLPDNSAMALDRSVRSSAQKLNLVAESIRGMDASKAVSYTHLTLPTILRV